MTTSPPVFIKPDSKGRRLEAAANGAMRGGRSRAMKVLPEARTGEPLAVRVFSFQPEYTGKNPSPHVMDFR